MSYNYPTELTASGLVSDTQGKLDALIDVFDLSNEPTNGHILSYNSTTKKIVAIANSGGGFDGTSNLVMTDGVSLLTPDSTAGITFQTSGSTFGSGVDYIQVGNVEAAANILPAGSSQNFGDATHRFDAFFGDLNVNGTITGFDTGDVAEGTNLYYTNARADARIAAASINALTDVDTTGVANGKILKYNSSTSKFEIADDSGGGGGIALTDISVTVGSNSGNGNLSYNNSTGVFTFNPSNLDNTSINDLNDVNTGGGSIADGKILKFNATTLDFEPVHFGGKLKTHSTFAVGSTITASYADGDVHLCPVTAANTGNITINTPSNMVAGNELTLILEGVGASGQDADMLLNITNLKIDTGFSSGFAVVYGRCQIWKIIFDGTNHYMYKANNTDLT